MALKPATQRSLDLVKKAVGLLKTQIGEVQKRLDDKIDRVAASAVKLQVDVSEIKETISTKLATKDDFKRILGYLDSFSGQLLTYSRETHTYPVLLDEHGKTLKDHSKRISALENPR
jgi:ABC-type transporter Mla subunit MlaD